MDVHLIYTESEDAIYDALMKKWAQDKELRETMSTIIREFGLNNVKATEEMQRSIGKGNRHTDAARAKVGAASRARNAIPYLKDGVHWMKATGRKPWNWQGGITPERQSFYIDGFRITGRRSDPPDNLVYLCRPCHKWVHSTANTERLFIGQGHEPNIYFPNAQTSEVTL